MRIKIIYTNKLFGGAIDYSRVSNYNPIKLRDVPRDSPYVDTTGNYVFPDYLNQIKTKFASTEDHEQLQIINVSENGIILQDLIRETLMNIVIYTSDTKIKVGYYTDIATLQPLDSFSINDTFEQQRQLQLVEIARKIMAKIHEKLTNNKLTKKINYLK